MTNTYWRCKPRFLVFHPHAASFQLFSATKIPRATYDSTSPLCILHMHPFTPTVASSRVLVSSSVNSSHTALWGLKCNFSLLYSSKLSKSSKAAMQKHRKAFCQTVQVVLNGHSDIVFHSKLEDGSAHNKTQLMPVRNENCRS